MRAGKCFIPGDTTHEKRGQFIEGVSKVYDYSDVNHQLSWDLRIYSSAIGMVQAFYIQIFRFTGKQVKKNAHSVY